jgi:hypothetical protein
MINTLRTVHEDGIPLALAMVLLLAEIIDSHGTVKRT